jgi:quinoprotein glucose dehydrogenase
LETNLESTPLVIDGCFYFHRWDRRDVSRWTPHGEVLWTHREDEGKRAEVSPRRLSGRGLAYWADGTPQQDSDRLFHAGLSHDRAGR